MRDHVWKTGKKASYTGIRSRPGHRRQLSLSHRLAVPGCPLPPAVQSSPSAKTWRVSGEGGEFCAETKSPRSNDYPSLGHSAGTEAGLRLIFWPSGSNLSLQAQGTTLPCLIPFYIAKAPTLDASTLKAFLRE